MNAELTTLCGCTRRIQTTFPPPPEIILPLRRRTLRLHLGDEVTPRGPDFKVRRFRLQYKSYYADDVASYEEEP